MNSEAVWLKLAVSDLKSAKILYSKKQFRTSYFLFQQAAEKANKAFAIKFNLAKEHTLKSVGHNQFKITRNYIIGKIKEFDTLPDASKKDPAKFAVKYQGLVNSLSSLDKLRNEDLINISAKDLNSLYKQAIAFLDPFQKRYPKMKEYFIRSKEAKNVNNIGLFLLKWMQEFYFILFTLHVCALITVQHTTLTRYPDDGKNPLAVYTMKLPLIKKQLLFMELLESAINKLKSNSIEKDILKAAVSAR